MGERGMGLACGQVNTTFNSHCTQSPCRDGVSCEVRQQILLGSYFIATYMCIWRYQIHHVPLLKNIISIIHVQKHDIVQMVCFVGFFLSIIVDYYARWCLVPWGIWSLLSLSRERKRVRKPWAWGLLGKMLHSQFCAFCVLFFGSRHVLWICG